MNKFDSAARVLSGTWGEVWLDNEYVAEAYKAQAKITYSKAAINRCGEMGEDAKITGYKGTGSIGFHKINSRMAKLIGKAIRNGRDVRFTIILKLADPDGHGQERIKLINVSFDDLTLADWEANNPGKIEAPFTFTNYDYIDEI